MIDYKLIPHFDQTKVVCFNTIRKTKDDLSSQVRFQKNSENALFYEEFSFYNGPLNFHSLIILAEGESVILKLDESQVDFVSETSIKSDVSEIRVFARMVDEKGLLKYKQLSLVENFGNNMVFVDTNSLELKSQIFVDKILVVGSFSAISYMVMAFKTGFKRFSTWNLFKANVYYGKDILDLNKHTIASESLCEPIESGYTEGMNGMKLLKETRMGNYKTMHDLTNYLMVNEQYEKIQNLKKNLNYLVDVDKSEKRLEESIAMLSKFVCNELLFWEYLDYNTLEALTKFVFTNIVYDQDNHNFKLMKLLAHDSRIAKYLLNHLNFGKTLESIFWEDSSMNQKNCLLNMLLILVSHPQCITKFLSNDSHERAFSYDYFVNSINTSSVMGSVYVKWLEEIGSNMSLYVALSQTESLYNKLSKTKHEVGRELDENMKSLSVSVNHSIDSVELMNKNKQEWSPNKIRFVRNFVVSCVKEFDFVKALESLLGMVYHQISEFPVLTIDVKAFVEKPFEFMLRYMEYFQFQGCITLLYQISTLVMKLSSPLSGSVRPGFPYLQEPLREYFESMARKCRNLLLYCKILSLLSFTISQGSFEATIDQMDAFSRKYSNFYYIFSKFMEKPVISNFILKSLNSYAILVRDDTPSALMNKISKNVSLLVNLICTTIYRERKYNVVTDFDKGFMNFIEFCLPKLTKRSGILDSHLVDSCVIFLKNMNRFTNLMSETPRKEPIEDVEQFLSSVLKSLGLDPAMIFKDYTVLKDSGESEFTDKNQRKNDLTSTKQVRMPPIQVLKASYFGKSGKIQQPNQSGQPTSGNTVSKAGSVPINKKRSLGEQDRVSALYCNPMSVRNIDWYPTNTCAMERAKQLGVQLDTFKYYESCGLLVLPADGLPIEVDYSMSYLISLAQTRDNAHLFRALMEKRGSKSLLGLWLYSLSTLNPDLNTLVNSEVNAFSSLVGYAWMDNLERCVETITKIMYIHYLSLRHLSLDTLNDVSEFSLEHNMHSYGEEFEGLGVHYINDELLNCLILSSTQVQTLIKTDSEHSRNYMEMLSKLVHYWFKRFKKSRTYMLNYLMATATVLPRLYEGVSFLILSCRPFTHFRTELSYKHVKSESETASRISRLDDALDNRKSLECSYGSDESSSGVLDNSYNDVLDNGSSASEDMETDDNYRVNSEYQLPQDEQAVSDCQQKAEQDKSEYQEPVKQETECQNSNEYIKDVQKSGINNSYDSKETKKQNETKTRTTSHNKRTFNFYDETYELDLRMNDSSVKGALNKVVNRYKEIDKMVLMEFICTLCTHSTSADAGTLISSSYLYYYMFINDLPVMDFESLVLKNAEDLNSRLRGLVFYSNIIRIYTLDICKRVEKVFGFNCDYMELITSFVQMSDLPLYAYTVLMEAIYHTFACQNKLWSIDHHRMLGHSKFGEYLSNMVSCVSWLLRVVNHTKFNFTKGDLDGLEEEESCLSSDALVLALYSLWTAFQRPFNLLTVLYSLNEQQDLIDYLNYCYRTVKRTSRSGDKVDSSGPTDTSNAPKLPQLGGEVMAQVRFCEFLNVNNMVDNLRELCSESEKLSPNSTFNLVYCYHLLLNVYNAILKTGSSQDVFILHMALNRGFDQISSMNKPLDLYDTTFMSLETLLSHVKSSEQHKHVSALILMVKSGYEELKNALLERFEPKLISSIPVSSLFGEQISESRLFYYTNPITSFTQTLMPTISSYRSWKQWERLVSLAGFEIDYDQKESFLPFTKNVNFEYKLEYPEFDDDLSKLTFEVKAVKPPMPNSVPTTDQWKEFSKQLSDNGLDLMALIKNPSILLDPKSRRQFIKTVLKNKPLYIHLTTIGIDVFN